MKLRNLFAICTLAALFTSSVTGWSQEATRKRMAVPPVENQTQSPFSGDMTNPIIQGLTKKKRRSYDVVERAQLDKVLGDLGMTGVIDENSAVKVGKELGADYVTLGAIVSADLKNEPYTKPYRVLPPIGPTQPQQPTQPTAPDRPVNYAFLHKNEEKKQELTRKYEEELRYYEEAKRDYEEELRRIPEAMRKHAEAMREYDAALPAYNEAMRIYNEEKRKAESIQYWRTKYNIKVSLKVVDVGTGKILTTAAEQSGGSQDWGTDSPRISDSLIRPPASIAFRSAGEQILEYFDPLIPVVAAVHGERKNKTVTIDRGKDDGMHVGMEFIATREGKAITDMAGKTIGVKKENIGDLVITEVHDISSIGRVKGEIKKLKIERGNVLIQGKLQRGLFGGVKDEPDPYSLKRGVKDDPSDPYSPKLRQLYDRQGNVVGTY